MVTVLRVVHSSGGYKPAIASYSSTWYKRLAGRLKMKRYLIALTLMPLPLVRRLQPSAQEG